MAVCSCAETESGDTYTYVVDEMRLLTSYEVVDGVSYAEGFDIDGIEGLAQDTTCFSTEPDHTAPDGQTGVDNSLASGAFAVIATAIAALGGDGGEGTDLLALVLQTAIRTGELLVLVTVSGVDSLKNDDDVKLSAHLALPTTANVGTDGRLLAGQSFDINPDLAPSIVRTQIRDGVLVARGLSIAARGSFIGIEFDLPISRGQIRLQFEPNGTVTGVLGGSIPIDAFGDVLPEVGSATPETVALGRAALRGLADLMNEETGECDSISAALRVHGVSAFIYDQPAGPTTDAP